MSARERLPAVGYLVEYLHEIDHEWRSSEPTTGRRLWPSKSVAEREAESWREDGYEARVVPVVREVAIAALRQHVLDLRSLIARLPITHCNSHPDLQAWWDEMKTVMETTDGLHEGSSRQAGRDLAEAGRQEAEGRVE